MEMETLSLVADRTAPATARRYLRSHLDDLPQEVLDDVLLLTTEVVTNSVRHADIRSFDRIHLAVRTSRTRLRIAITDPGRGEPFAPRQPDLSSTGGRGLLLLAEMSDRWGIDRRQATTVWFELSLSERVASRAG